MNTSYRKTFLASAIAVLISAPAFAAEGIQSEGESTPGKAGTEKPVTEKPMDMEPKMGGKSMGMTTKTQARGDNPIYSRSADELEGTEVVDSAGENVGTIKHVVFMRDRHSAHAVISTGGLLGLGERDIVVSLDELDTVGEELQLKNTKEQIQARKEYQPEQYVELKGDKPIGVEFSAFEPADSDSDPELVPEPSESTQ
ncbi:PRC-barrel domain-containing protein [Thiohalobacter thiocyanaticus]|uniref:PRC-barrel domain containing protein n=1 Tax=Thiohalobacter thiocyanaticus TaxID=585455 RepID=A0A426QH46_9GAMM|nr:PRC-barrel domain-containing protein [Thiohalobacter thiocyanaticus]RRQ21063.1 PRC-barrel domain containing protein [Thiohalobacter thiocyanaticus]